MQLNRKFRYRALISQILPRRPFCYLIKKDNPIYMYGVIKIRLNTSFLPFKVQLHTAVYQYNTGHEVSGFYHPSRYTRPVKTFAQIKKYPHTDLYISCVFNTYRSVENGLYSEVRTFWNRESLWYVLSRYEGILQRTCTRTDIQEKWIYYYTIAR